MTTGLELVVGYRQDFKYECMEEHIKTIVSKNLD